MWNVQAYCVISHVYQTEALLLFLLLSQEPRHLNGMLFLQAPLHVLQNLCTPLGLLCSQMNICKSIYLLPLNGFILFIHFPASLSYI